MLLQNTTTTGQVNTLFKKNLPTYPYATNSFEDGLYRHRKDRAKNYKYIQFNNVNSLGTMVVDIDRDVYYDDIEPKPNLVVMNKDNSRCHSMYIIKPAVHLNEFSSRKPIAFAQNILAGLTARLKGDENFAHLVSKNPLNDSYRVFTPRIEPYDLTELAEWVPSKGLNQAPREGVGNGRNSQVFDWCREWAYIAIRGCMDLGADNFYNQVLARCLELNTRVYLPMTIREVKTIAKSIAKWVWNNRQKLTNFSKQTARAKRLGVQRREAMSERQAEAYKLRAEGLTQLEIAKLLNVSTRTIKTYLSVSS